MLGVCKEIVIFLLIAKLLEGLQSGKKYGKFVKLIISLIVVLKLISPVFSVFDKGLDFAGITAEMESRFSLNGEDINIQEETKQIEKVDISKIDINVEEIQWEK